MTKFSTNSTMHASYILPVVNHKIEIPPNCLQLVIQMCGGASSASFDGNSIIGGACGGNIIARFNAPSINDEIVLKLGMGGGFKISENNEIVNANPGQDSILMVNGEIVAIAQGAQGSQGGDMITYENKYCTFKMSRGQDGSTGKRAISEFEYTQSSIDDCFIELYDCDGVRGNGGVGIKLYSNKTSYGLYLGAGSHGYAKTWKDVWYYYCFKCYKKYYTIESYEEHETEEKCIPDEKIE